MVCVANSFQDLLVWQKAHQFVLNVYELTKSFPPEERYGLTSQFRRAAISIPANIAEGFRKKSVPDKLRFYNISQGSLEECRYFIILAQDLGYAEIASCQEILEDTSRLLNKYVRTINSQ